MRCRAYRWRRATHVEVGGCDAVASPYNPVAAKTTPTRNVQLGAATQHPCLLRCALCANVLRVPNRL